MDYLLTTGWAAREREEARHNQYTEPSANFAEGSKGNTMDKVARATGVSRETHRKEMAVAEAAEKEPEKYGSLVEAARGTPLATR